MNIKIALVDAGDDRAVLRGSPDRVNGRVDAISRKGVKVEILCSVEKNVSSQLEEDGLWEEFVQAANQIDQRKLAADKHQIWRRKAYYLWIESPNPGYLGIFMAKLNDAVFSVEPGESMIRNFGNPRNN